MGLSKVWMSLNDLFLVVQKKRYSVVYWKGLKYFVTILLQWKAEEIPIHMTKLNTKSCVNRNCWFSKMFSRYVVYVCGSQSATYLQSVRQLSEKWSYIFSVLLQFSIKLPVKFSSSFPKLWCKNWRLFKNKNISFPYTCVAIL